MTLGRTLSLMVLATLVAGQTHAGKPDGNARPDPGPSEVGELQTVHVVPNLGHWVRRGERRSWTDRLSWPGASFLRIRIVDLDLHDGDALVIRAGSGRVIERLTGRGPKARGTFWGLTVFEDTLSLELDFKAPYSGLPFRIDRVLVGEPGLFEPVWGSPESICAPADYEDVICYQGDALKWSNVLASVGVMTFGSNPNTGLWCSGSNVSPNNYLLTNQHCIENQGDCDDAEFVFKFYRTDCGTGAPPTADYQGFRCDELVASSPYLSCDAGVNDLDFALSSVIGDPAASFGYARPDPTPLTSGETIYIVQHPNGRPHEIAHGGGADVVVDTSGNLRTIRYYDTLDTEGGSSGSPIYRDADDLLVGLHHCGGCTTPGVGNRGMLMSAIYPHIESYLCSASFDLAAAGSEGLTEVSGNGDGVLDPGETWQLHPRVRNSSCAGDATGVEAELQVGTGSAPGVTLLDTVADFGTIAAGATAASATPVRFELAAAFPCGGEVVLDVVEVTANEGGPFGPQTGIFSSGSGYPVFLTLLSETFDGPFPGGWTIVDGGSGGGAASTWTTANPGARSVGLIPPFAIVDSDVAGTGATQDESLISPLLDLSARPTVELQFQHNFRWYNLGQNEKADVDVRSTATGGAWVNLVRYQGASASGSVVLDASAELAGQVDAQFRFRYYDAQYEWWWAVDDVRLGADLGRVCYPWSPDQLFYDDFETGGLVRWSATSS